MPKERQTIKGRPAGSKEEGRVARSLEKYKIDYFYQVPIRGGRWVAGGQVIDFIALIPFPQPIQVYGEYWHENQLSTEEHFRLAIVMQEIGREPLVWWGEQLETQEESDFMVQRHLL